MIASRDTIVVGAAALLAAVACLVLPGAASAQLIFDHGNDIWAAGDDGSNPHLLVRAASLGMDAGLGSPAVAPDGDTLLFVGTTKRNQVAGVSQNFYGEGAAGVYELRGGVVRRLSAPPTAGPSPWTTLDDEPEPAPGGTYVYKYRTCTEEPVLTEFGFIWNPFCKNELRSSTLAAGAAGSTKFATPCDSDAEGGPAAPSPDPAGGSGLVAYVGCQVETEPMRRGALMISGPGEAGEEAIAVGPELTYGSADTAFADPSWSLDGSQVAVYASGGTSLGEEPEETAGIYLVDAVAPYEGGPLVLRAPEEAEGVYEKLASPRFVGANTIAFVAGGSVWSVPASCDECAMAGATKLVSGGPSAAEQAFSVTWTSREVAPASVYPGQGGGPAPAPTPAPGREAGEPGRHRGHGEALKLTIARVRAPRLRKLLAKGLPVTARCSRACHLTLTLKKKKGKRWRVVGRAKAKLRAGKLSRVRVHLTHKARRSLRRAHRLKLRLSGVARAKGLSPARSGRTVKVKR